MKRPNVIRAGDAVRVVTPRVLVRVGYPKTVDDYLSEAREAVAKMGLKFGKRINDKIAREVAYGLAKRDGFGGPHRTLHLRDSHDLSGATCTVHHVRSVLTGRYFPPSPSGPDYEGEYEYEPGGLTDPETHRIATVYPRGGRWNLSYAPLEIPVRFLEKVTP